MEKKKFIKSLAIIALSPALFFAACTGDQKNKQQKTTKVQTYTCSMHPQIIQDKPGTCPICAMDLVPFEKSNADPALNLDNNQQALANITTIKVGLNDFVTYKQLNGRLVVDPEKTDYMASRNSGRLTRLYIRQTGETIKKGQPIYQIYSEQLASLQQEFLLALAQASQFPSDKVFAQLVNSSKQKLILYGLAENQIKKLESVKKTDPYITYYATTNGTVADLPVTEGQYVTEGTPIMRLEGYHSLWVEADIYPAEVGEIKQGQQLKVVIPGWENQPQMVTIKFINPALQANTQIMQLRASISNPNNQWQPGLQANVFVPTAGNAKKLISLPIDAVIRDGKGAHVWIEKSKGKFEPQMVELGKESFDGIEITAGLQAGDQVVTTGAYLLYSEYILKKGKNPMANMKM